MKRTIEISTFAFYLSLISVTATSAQIATAPTPIAASAPTLVPALIPYSGTAIATDGKPLAGDVSVTFLLFKDDHGGDPIWIESQTVAVDATGHYQVKLGASSANGLPLDTFSSGEVRWLEVQIAGQPIGPRTLLTSVPYALKAADAATLGGLPASAFMLASSALNSVAVSANAITPDTSSTVTTSGGTSFYVPRFSGATTVVNSEIYDNGTSVGIGDLPNASAKLDVNGAMIMRGNMTVSRTGNATSSKGYPSYGFDFFSNAYNSSSKATVNPYFQLQSEPTGNDTASPSATFNLLFSNNGSSPAETGFYINPDGTIHFASGQTFPATDPAGIAIDGTSSSGTGVEGTSSSGNGVVGSTSGSTDSTAGVYGVSGLPNTSGLTGIAGVWGDSSTDAGVYGTSDQGPGIDGISGNSYGVIGGANGNGGGNGAAGVYGYSNASGVVGVIGQGGPYGTGGSFAAGPTPDNYVPGDGIAASGGSASEYYAGIGGRFYGGNASGSGSGGDGVYVVAGTNPNNTYAYAGVFLGTVQVDGTLNSDAATSKIDHPLDPANKYLTHASIESSEMVNIYSGNVTTDAQGMASVQLPDWFEALNGDLRYQLTPIGQFAQAMVATELANGSFVIRTDKGHVKVSWQVTGVRQDAYARAHPLVVEQEKDARERGFYRHPELYGQPREKQTELGRHPAAMRQMPPPRDARGKNLPDTGGLQATGTPSAQHLP